MRKLLLFSFLLFSVSLFGQAKKVTLYLDAAIFTADEKNPQAEAMLVEGGKILYVGKRSKAEQMARGREVETIRLQGKMILPGFVESHMHPVLGSLMQLDFYPVSPKASVKEILSVIRKAAQTNPQAPILLLQGYCMSHFSTLPTAQQIDSVVNDKPVILFDEGFHSAWVNTRCLEMAQVTKETPDPLPGLQYFERDAQGNPTGYMFDILTWQQILNRLNILSEEVIYNGVNNLLKTLHADGFTSVFDAGAAPSHHTQYSAITRLDKEGKLNIHYCGSYYLNPSLEVSATIDSLRNLRNRFATENVKVNTLKLILDGTIEAKTAATIEPLIGEEKCAPLFVGEEKFYQLFRAALAEGFDTHVHTIGDSAVSAAINVFTRLDKFPSPGTKTICHNQMYPANGVERIGKLKGLFFQTTPAWIGKDEYTPSVLGEERISRMYPTNSVRKKGLTVTFGCDFPASPVEMLNPLQEIYYAVLRGLENNLLYPSRQEGISVEEALKAYTINGARQLRIDDITGSLTAGKLADFVILDKNLLTLPVEEIPTAKVLATYFRGTCVSRHDD